MSMPSLPAALFVLLSASLTAQGHVDVLRDEIYVYSSMGPVEGSDKLIHRLGADGAHETIALPASKTVSFIGWPRPRVRLGRFWISDGKKMFSTPLDGGSGEEWEPVKLPEGISQFRDFDIISDTDAIICGCLWDVADGESVPARYDMHFVFNHKTGAIKKTIGEIEPYTVSPLMDYFILLKQTGSHLCRFDPYIVIVGEFTGKVTVFDTDKGSAAEHQVVPAEDIPEDPQQAVNNRRRIDWVGPLDGGEAVLRCCRLVPLPEGETGDSYLVSHDESGEEKRVPWPHGDFRKEHYFCTMNLKTGKVRREGAEYRGFDAKGQAAFFERNGELLSVRDVIAGKADGEAKAVAPAKTEARALTLD